jgi:hypothetical protein
MEGQAGNLGPPHVKYALAPMPKEMPVLRTPDDLTPGLVTSARIELGDLLVEVQPLAFGPLRLEAPDGRVSEFPRAMCAVLAADGRSGVAWVEWNRNRSLTGPI